MGNSRARRTRYAARVIGAKRLVWSGVGALLLSACGGGDSTAPTRITEPPPPPPPPAVTGTISGSVRVDGQGRSGVRVTLSGPSVRTATTAAGGTYSFTAVPAGSYNVDISDLPAEASFPATRLPVVITTAGQQLVVDFAGQVARTASIAGGVTVDGVALAGVTVTLAGAALPGAVSREVQTDSQGNYGFTGLEAGAYTITLSGFPASADFESVSREITLSQGQSARVDFTAAAPAPAKIAILGLATLNGAAVDLTNVSGSFSVRLAVTPGGQTIERLEVRLADAIATDLVFPVGSPGGSPTAPFNTTLIVHSADYNDSTGTPDYLNGAKALSAAVRTTSGADAWDTLPAPIILRNADLLRGRISSTAEATDSLGRLWRGGDLTVELVPTLYSGRTLGSTDATFFAVRSTANPARFARRELGEVNSSAAPPENLLVKSVLSNGEAGPSFRAAVRYESVPPQAQTFFWLTEPGQYDFTAPGVYSFNSCCRRFWVDPDYRWDARGRLSPTDGWDGTPGVGGAYVTFHAGPAALSPEQLAARPHAETPREAGLRQTSTNDAYKVVARIVDALGNSRLVPIRDANPQLSVSFGVDATPPTGQALIPAQTTAVDRAVYSSALRTASAINPVVTFAASDPESGVEGGLTSIEELRNAQHPESRCLNAGSCEFPFFRFGFTRSLTTSFGEGYYRFRHEIFNGAGLRSGRVDTIRILLDTTPPAVQAPAILPRLRVGESLSVPVAATDNVDLLEFEPAAEFTASPGLPTVFPLARATAVGTPFTDRLSTRLSQPNHTVPFSVVALEPVDAEGRPRGTNRLAPITAMQVRVRDAGMNTGVGRTALIPTNQPNGRSFLEDPVFGEAGGTLHLRVNSVFPGMSETVRLCINDDRPCPAGSARSLTLNAVAEWTSPDPDVYNPAGWALPFRGDVLFYFQDNLGSLGGAGSLRTLKGTVTGVMQWVAGTTQRLVTRRVTLLGSELRNAGWANEQRVPIYTAAIDPDTGTLLAARPLMDAVILVDNK